MTGVKHARGINAKNVKPCPLFGALCVYMVERLTKNNTKKNKARNQNQKNPTSHKNPPLFVNKNPHRMTTSLSINHFTTCITTCQEKI